MHHAYIIVSNNEETAKQKAHLICKDHNIHRFDISIHVSEKSIGIEEIRTVQKAIMLTPIRGLMKAVIIVNAQHLTIPAQNALLKMLEEPPKNTIIFLLTSKKDALLPTVISRCHIIDLDKKNISLPEKESIKYQEIFTKLSTMGVASRLKLAQDIAKDKPQTLLWLEKMILTARETLIADGITDNTSETSQKQPSQRYHDLNHSNKKEVETIQYSYSRIIKSLQHAHTILSTTNTNPRLTLEHLLLSINFRSPTPGVGS